MTEQAAKRIDNIHNCHIIRGIAAAIVVLFHAKFVIWSGGQQYLKQIGVPGFLNKGFFFLDLMSTCGEQCVVVFYFLSSFFIQYSFQLNRYSWSKFYTIRGIRIYLPYLASLLFSMLVLWLSVRHLNPVMVQIPREYNQRLALSFAERDSFGGILKSLVFLRNTEYPGFNFAYWSLLHEGVFYLLFPFYLVISRSNKALFLTALVQIGLFCFTKWLIVYYQVFFVAGLLFYRNLDWSLGYLCKVRPSLVISALAITYVFMNLVLKVKYGHTIADYLSIIIAVLAMAYLVLFKERIKKGIFIWLGEISYSVYLFHLPLLLLQYSLITRYFKQPYFYCRMYYIIAIVAIMIASLFYLLIEKKTLRLIKRLK